MKEAYSHNIKNALVFGDHHHDSLCVEKLNLENTITLAFCNYDKQHIRKEKPEQIERYKLHWDGVLYNEESFDFHHHLLETIKKQSEIKN